jgi:hypothetical protein
LSSKVGGWSIICEPLETYFLNFITVVDAFERLEQRGFTLQDPHQIFFSPDLLSFKFDSWNANECRGLLSCYSTEIFHLNLLYNLCFLPFLPHPTNLWQQFLKLNMKCKNELLQSLHSHRDHIPSWKVAWLQNLQWKAEELIK